MNCFCKIIDMKANEILDSRGNPTVHVEVTAYDEIGQRIVKGCASVPSGASTGKFEAVELRDGENRYFGLGVRHAVENVNKKIKPLLLGMDVLNQNKIDKIMIEADGTENKENLGANATLGVSMAVARTAAESLKIPLYRYLGGVNANVLPVPMMNILNGGKHAANTVDFQEFMVMPVAAQNFRDALQICAEIYHNLKKILQKKGLSTGVGDEGGFAPDLADAEDVLYILSEAVNAAGYRIQEEVQFSIDAAASELYDENTGTYLFEGESRLKGQTIIRDTDEMIAYYERLCEDYPIISIEDCLDQSDWEGFQKLTSRMGDKVQLVGDDLFVTNVKRLDAGIKLHAANAILVKVNQIGTLTEAMNAVELAKRNGYRTIISHRSGETEDSFIADFAVACNAGQIKSGAPCRSERVAKYNRLLQIENELEDCSRYPKSDS